MDLGAASASRLRRRRNLARTLGLILLVVAAPAQGRTIRLVIDHREPATFPSPTPYERPSGHFVGTLDPKNASNAVIDDLLLAPRNAPGMLEYSATFTLLRRSDPARVKLASIRRSRFHVWLEPPSMTVACGILGVF
jgi:hypothetical protein